MAEFAEVIKQQNRMCESYTDCWQCSISRYNSSSRDTCTNFMKYHPQEAEEIIMKWAEEHPIKTNADKFEEVFGFEPTTNFCPYAEKYCERFCEECDRDNFWTQEYKENE